MWFGIKPIVRKHRTNLRTAIQVRWAWFGFDYFHWYWHFKLIQFGSRPVKFILKIQSPHLPVPTFMFSNQWKATKIRTWRFGVTKRPLRVYWGAHENRSR